MDKRLFVIFMLISNNSRSCINERVINIWIFYWIHHYTQLAAIIFKKLSNTKITFFCKSKIQLKLWSRIANENTPFGWLFRMRKNLRHVVIFDSTCLASNISQSIQGWKKGCSLMSLMPPSGPRLPCLPAPSRLFGSFSKNRRRIFLPESDTGVPPPGRGCPFGPIIGRGWGNFRGAWQIFRYNSFWLA